jgi:uncharacterized protein YndB with AHSA1/START domain
MRKDDYRPRSEVEAQVRSEGGRWTLVFVRRLKHPPSEVWRALTDPDELREWAPFDADRDLGSTGAAKLTLVGGPSEEVFESEVRRAEAPRLLEYTWGGDVVRFELEAIESGRGTRLTLSHTLEDRTWLPKVAAGWHICIDVCELALEGRPIGRIVAGEARRFGWEDLNAQYAERFGVENTGWPERMGKERL